MTNKKPMRPYVDLVPFLLLCLVVSLVGGWVTSSSVDTWYPSLQKPVFNPPDWVFAPVWTTLFLMIAIAGWRVWRQRHTTTIRMAMAVYLAQLVLNLAWSVLFFGIQRVDLAALEIFVLLAAILWNIRLFWPIERLAAYLLLPYALWVGYAALLTVSIWRLNAG